MDKRSENRLARVHQLVAEVGSLASFAACVGISPAQAWQVASKTPRRGIGAHMAARIEQAFSKPPGWLDSPINQDSTDTNQEDTNAWPFRMASRNDFDKLTEDERRDLDRTVTRFIAGCLASRQQSPS